MPGRISGIRMIHGEATPGAAMYVDGISQPGQDLLRAVPKNGCRPSAQAGRQPECGCGLQAAASAPLVLEAGLEAGLKAKHLLALEARSLLTRLGRVKSFALDEVGELPLGLQVQLLRVLQERTYKRVGSNIWRKTDFRLIGATNRDLLLEEKQGRFRRELTSTVKETAIRIAVNSENGNLQRAARRLGVTDRALQMWRAEQTSKVDNLV